MSVQEITDGLQLHTLRTNSWHIQASCACQGDGLYEGLDWMAHAKTNATIHDNKPAERKDVKRKEEKGKQETQKEEKKGNQDSFVLVEHTVDGASATTDEDEEEEEGEDNSGSINDRHVEVATAGKQNEIGREKIIEENAKKELRSGYVLPGGKRWLQEVGRLVF